MCGVSLAALSLAAAAAALLLLSLPAHDAAAQEVSVAGRAEQRSVEVRIGEDGQVRVKHVVQGSSVPRQVDLLDGRRDNIRVTDGEGGEVQHAMVGGDRAVLFFPSGRDGVVEYDLEGALTQVRGVWTWDFLYLESTQFSFPGHVDMIFVTNKPVMLDDKRAINCHGCQMILEFFADDDVQVEGVEWGGREFSVPIMSLTEIRSLSFDQPEKSISFEVTEGGGFVTVVLPLELLWDPYRAYLDDRQIPAHGYIKNGTHVWLSFRPASAGTVTIIGTTAVPEFSLFPPLALGIVLAAAAAAALLRGGGGSVIRR